MGPVAVGVGWYASSVPGIGRLAKFDIWMVEAWRLRCEKVWSWDPPLKLMTGLGLTWKMRPDLTCYNTALNFVLNYAVTFPRSVENCAPLTMGTPSWFGYPTQGRVINQQYNVQNFIEIQSDLLSYVSSHKQTHKRTDQTHRPAYMY